MLAASSRARWVSSLRPETSMKQLIILAIVSVLAACGGKKAESMTPTNKTGITDTSKSGSMGGTTYGGGSAAPKAPTSGGDPCLM